MLGLGGAFKAFEKILVNKILLSPIRENIKCPKALLRGLLEFRQNPVHLRAERPDEPGENP